MNNIIFEFSNYIGKNINIKNEYIYLLLITIICLGTIRIFSESIKKIIIKKDGDHKSKYIHNHRIMIINNIISFIIIFLIWDSYLKNIITIISFISAAITIALREIIFNYFAGIYIKIKKIFKVEDRIEINDFKGDIININLLSFELLEISSNEYGEQSTGKIIHIPNSYIFTHPIKNYVKEFKYIWHEMIIKIPYNADIKTSKNIIYKIVNNNQTITSIPKKMKRQIDNVDLTYRIYFSKLEPIIYTKVVDDHIELYLRFLIHPKKIRNVEDDIWLKLLDANKKGEFMLYKFESNMI